MAISFWIAVATGLLIAIPIMSRPDREFVWGGLGTAVTWVQTLLQLSNKKQTHGWGFYPEERCSDLFSTGRPTCSETPAWKYVEPPPPDPIGDFWRGVVEFGGEFLANAAGMAIAALIEILVVLAFMGKEQARKKRQEIFHPRSQ